MGSILVVLIAAVDGEDGAERGHRVRRIGDLEAIAVVERGPRLFHAGDGLAALRDGVVDAEEITLDLPAQLVQRRAAAKQRQIPRQVILPPANAPGIRARQ